MFFIIAVGFLFFANKIWVRNSAPKRYLTLKKMDFDAMFFYFRMCFFFINEDKREGPIVLALDPLEINGKEISLSCMHGKHQLNAFYKMCCFYIRDSRAGQHFCLFVTSVIGHCPASWQVVRVGSVRQRQTLACSQDSGAEGESVVSRKPPPCPH
jgi:hypothetical protein